jgi:hypothetical protein
VNRPLIPSSTKVMNVRSHTSTTSTHRTVPTNHKTILKQVFPVQATKTFLILNLCNKLEVGGQPHAPAAISHYKEPQKTLNRQLGATPSRTASFGVKKNDCPLAEIEPRVLGD